MSIIDAVRGSLGVKVSLKLSVVLLVLTVGAASAITWQQTKQMEEMTLEKAKLAAGLAARNAGDVLDAAIDHDLITVQEAFDRNYEEIKGHNWGKKPRFHSKTDIVTDANTLLFQDKVIEDENFVFAIIVDDNGYMPTHNAKFQRPPTDDPEKDLTVYRSKIMANYPLGLAAARSVEPYLVQVYKRDTGETMWDVSAPIFVKGKHWGAVRLGVSMVKIEQAQRALLLTLAGTFVVFLFVTLLAMYLVVRRAMGPVLALTAAAEQISMGEGLDTPVKARSPDEIGKLTKTIDRLRVSMKAAMSRLGH
jgi:HAMP domain-containing protein